MSRSSALAVEFTDAGGLLAKAAAFEPNPRYVLPMSDVAAKALVHALVERGKAVTSVNSSRPAAELHRDSLPQLLDLSKERA